MKEKNQQTQAGHFIQWEKKKRRNLKSKKAYKTSGTHKVIQRIIIEVREAEKEREVESLIK